MPKDLSGKRVTVMGLGRFGGGLGVTRWLADAGSRVLVTDASSAEPLAGPLRDLERVAGRGRVELRLGGHVEDDFTACDLVVVNPAVPRPWENRFLIAARAAGVPLTTEIRLLLERLPRRRVIGVTGTAGKSTTASMVHHVLTRAGVRSHLGGNIGGSLLPRLGEITADDWIVLELSSAMLHWLRAGAGYDSAPGISPHVAVLTNLAPNHLDWHGSMAHYEASKRSIFAAQEAGDHQVLGAELPRADPPVPIRLPGEHNQRNAVTALHAASCAVNAAPLDLAPLLDDFEALPHRLRLVAEHDGRRFYDDSKSTVPDATVRAVDCFEPSVVHLIAGGYDKDLDLAPIARLGPRLAGLYTMGATGATLARAAAGAEHCGTLPAAVARAVARMKPGDVLLLSPGCASWDQFENYEERGRVFGEEVARAIAARPQLAR